MNVNTNPDPTNQDGGTPPSLEDLQKQIENLNKGIATYRQEAKAAKEEAAIAKKEALDLKKNLDAAVNAKQDADGDEIAPLSKEDQKRLEKWAKQQGFATKEELIQERQRIQGDTIQSIENTAVEEFLKQHPEYDDDEKWKKLKKEFDQYKQPTSLSEYRRILTRIHKDLNPDSDEAKAKALAELEIKKRLGLGGGHQPSGEKGGDELENLQKKYPRLSKEQILSRLSEIRSLYPDKK